MTVRTLIVDDDVRVADIHKSYVEKVDGFEVAGIANRGTEALRRVLDDQPDLVLLDIYLPDLGGLEVCRRLRAAGNLVDVIAVTAARDVETVRAATGLGIAQYLVKPFAFATFREKLERYAAYRARAAEGGEAGQDEIDAMLGELRSSTRDPAPEGPQPRDARPRRPHAPRDGHAARRRRDRRRGGPQPRHRPPLSRAPRVRGQRRAGAQVRRRPPGAPVPLGQPLASTAVPSFRAAYLIHGDDHGRIAERRASCARWPRKPPAAPGSRSTRPTQCTPENVAAALSPMTFAMGRRFVIADGVERWKDSDVEPVAQALHSADPETLTVAFFAREEGRYKVPAKLVQAVEKAGGQIAAELNVKSWDLPKWLIEQAARTTSRSTRTAPRRSSPRSATASSGCSRELEKLALEHGPGARSAPTRSTRPAPPRAERKVWTLADALVAGDRRPRSSC